MAKKSFDFSKVKELLFEKGERFALIAVAIVTALILFLGTLGPMAPSTSPPATAGAATWEAAIKSKVKVMDEQIRSSQPGDNDIPKVKKSIDPRFTFTGMVAALGPRTGMGHFLAFGARYAGARPPKHDGDYELIDNPQFAIWSPLINPDTEMTNERINPPILMMGSPKAPDRMMREVQVDYFPAPAVVLDADLTNPKKMKFMAIVNPNDKSFAPSMLLEPKRMVVISMAFPIKDQLEAYQLALRYPSIKQMLEKGEAPRFLGLNIWKQQIGPDGKETKAEPLYQYDEKEDRIMARSEGLDSFFRRMQIDSDNPKQLAVYLGPNMVTPLPALASVQKGDVSYPPPRLPGLPVPPEETETTTSTTDPKKDPGGFGLGKKKDPKAVSPTKEVVGTLQTKDIKELKTEIRERLKGNYNVFDPYGAPITPDKDVKEEKKSGNFGDVFMQKKKSKDEEGKGEEEITRLLARFIDVDAQVGKTYRYWVQVRVASPNYGRTEDVAHLDIGKDAELISDWSHTPWVTVPGETSFFAVDQFFLPERTDAMPANTGTGVDKDKVDADKTVVQLHRWLEKAGERPIGDWAVAERLSIRRGDVIFRKDIRIEVPEWDAKKGRFELGFYEKGKTRIPGIPVTFSLGEPAPILVDFQGGKRDYKLPGKVNLKNEEAAVEMLVLTPEGNLIVRNSRVDSDPTTDIGRFRSMNYWRWRNRVRAVREQSGGTGSAFPTK